MQEQARNDIDGRPGQMVQLVRTARGLTQTQLARRSGISQAVLSKVESGVVDLEPDRLELLADALEVPVSRFASPGAAGGVLSACAFHRKRNSLPVSDAKRIRALMDLTRLQIEEILSVEERPVEVPRKAPSEDGWDTPQDIARAVREAMAAGPSSGPPPDGPLNDLVGAVEALGAVIIVTDLQAARIDAIGSWPDGHRPVFLLNSRTPADRRRFTLAHELGHAVMHRLPTPDQEAEADEFASELLMPANTIRRQLANLDLAKLVTLKPQWGTSMAALIRRAKDTGAINDHEYKQLNIALSTAGYRKNEPITLPPEVPTLVTRCIRERIDDGATTAGLAELTDMTVSDFTHTYLGTNT